MAILRFIFQRASELLRPISGREFHDVLVGDDLRPAFAEFANVTTWVRNRISRLIPPATARRRRHARQQVTKALRQTHRDLLILFLCAGNICRSPFAEALLRARLNERSIRISSAGMMPQTGRPTPALALKAASIYGIDLSRHRSIWLTRDAAHAASLIFVFDEVNREALLDRYPKLGAQVVSLGDLTGAPRIADPIDGDLKEFAHVYRNIAEAITEFVSLSTARSWHS
jgi:protein-tyrosine phosphatase